MIRFPFHSWRGACENADQDEGIQSLCSWSPVTVSYSSSDTETDKCLQ